MKTNLILARTSFGCAALFVNQAVVLEAKSLAELDKLVDAATKLSSALGVGLTDHTLTSAETCWSKDWSDSAPNWSALALQLDAAPGQPDIVPVQVWEAYEGIEHTAKPNMHTLEIIDTRQSSGQARLILAPQAGGDALLDVLLEVQPNPFNPTALIPAALVHVDMDDPVLSILKLEDKLVIRPNTGVTIVHEVVNIDGKPEDVILIQ
jgi:hypothetical protein